LYDLGTIGLCHKGITLFSFFSGKNKQPGLVGIQFGAGGINVAYRKPDGEVSADACVHVSVNDEGQWLPRLREVVGRLGISGEPVNVVLPADDYHLVMVERPQVEADELKQAIRWRIKDLVDFGVTDASVDVIDIPEDAFRGRAAMTYAVAARKSVVDQMANVIASADLELKYIDVPETVMGNLLPADIDENRGTAVLYLQPGKAVVDVVKNNQLYFTRQLSFDGDYSHGEGVVFDSLALEIQRSLDYFESQLRQAPVAKFLVSPQAMASEAVCQALRDRLGMAIEVLSVEEKMPEGASLDTVLQRDCCLAIAAALRAEEVVE